MIKQKRKRKTMVSAKRDEQKQKVMKKRMQETLDERKNVFHERVFFFLKKKRKIFSENKNEIKQTKSLFVRKKCLD